MASWQIGPVLRGMRGHRSAAVLVMVQLGIGLAITVLALLIGDYMSRTTALSGFPAEELTLVELQLPGRLAGGDEAERRRAALLAGLRGTPGIIGAAVVGQVPQGPFERGPDYVRRSPDAARMPAWELEAGPGVAEVAGLRLRGGRDITEADLRGDATAAIISTTFADALWPGQDPVGRTFDSRAHGRAVVVGVAADMRTHLIGLDEANVIYAKDDPRSARTLALVRSSPGRAAEVRAALRERLRQPGQAVKVTSADIYNRHSMGTVKSVIGILGIIIGAMVVVVLLGSMGLTYYLVARRTREIGLRRAMGATRRDVVRSFIVENVIFTIGGALVGLAIVLAVLPSFFLHQPGFAVNWLLVVIGGGGVIALNLIATWIPARRAATVPPVVASRTA